MPFYFCRMERSNGQNILIVGAGLAGLCLGVQLYRRGVPFRIRHSDAGPCASERAAGIINPVVVKRLLKSWMVDIALPYSRNFYRETERLTGTGFYSPMPIYRLFTNEEVAVFWRQRAQQGDMADYLSPGWYAYAPDVLIQNRFNGADILGSARVECDIFTGTLRRFFAERGLLENHTCEYAAIRPGATGIEVNGERFTQVVFCEGTSVVHNPWFGKLPLVPTKGELLYLNVPGFPVDKAVLRGVFLAPLTGGDFVCGSTYEWQFADEGPTEAAKNKLSDELSQMLRIPYEIKRHTAGVRPASRDRRPLLGEHPVQKGLFVFNGLGTKGYLLAPYLSYRLAQRLLDGVPLDRETDIVRLKQTVTP